MLASLLVAQAAYNAGIAGVTVCVVVDVVSAGTVAMVVVVAIPNVTVVVANGTKVVVSVELTVDVTDGSDNGSSSGTSTQAVVKVVQAIEDRPLGEVLSLVVKHSVVADCGLGFSGKDSSEFGGSAAVAERKEGSKPTKNTFALLSTRSKEWHGERSPRRILTSQMNVLHRELSDKGNVGHGSSFVFEKGYMSSGSSSSVHHSMASSWLSCRILGAQD